MFVLNNRPIEYIIICPAGDMRVLLYLDQFQLTTNKKETLKRKLLLKSYKKEDCYLLVRQGIDSINDSSAHFLSESTKKFYQTMAQDKNPYFPPIYTLDEMLHSYGYNQSKKDLLSTRLPRKKENGHKRA